MRAFVFLLHELARDSRIDDVPRKNFIVSTPATGVKVGIDLSFANRRIQVAVTPRRCFYHAADSPITRREESLFVSNTRRHRANFDVGNARELPTDKFQ